jgi:peptide/nickel transport system substrate-binding protein
MPAPARRALVIAQLREPSSLNPLLIDGSVAENLGALAFSYLVAVDDRGRLVPDVATAVPTLANGGIARDGRHLTYHLRHGVRWGDGEPLIGNSEMLLFVALATAASRLPRLGTPRFRTPPADDGGGIRSSRRLRTLRHSW